LLRFDVKHQDPGVERVFDLLSLFTDAGKNDFRRVRAHFQSAKQFAARDDIKPASLFGEGAQQSEIGVGFDGKTNDVPDLTKCLVENFKMTLQRRQAINVSWRADFPRYPF